MYNLVFTSLYIFLWFSCFGGIGLRTERKAEIKNITCNSTHGGENSILPGEDNLFRLSCRLLFLLNRATIQMSKCFVQTLSIQCA